MSKHNSAVHGFTTGARQTARGGLQQGPEEERERYDRHGTPRCAHTPSSAVGARGGVRVGDVRRRRGRARHSHDHRGKIVVRRGRRRGPRRRHRSRRGSLRRRRRYDCRRGWYDGRRRWCDRREERARRRAQQRFGGARRRHRRLGAARRAHGRCGAASGRHRRQDGARRRTCSRRSGGGRGRGSRASAAGLRETCWAGARSGGERSVLEEVRAGPGGLVRARRKVVGRVRAGGRQWRAGLVRRGAVDVGVDGSSGCSRRGRGQCQSHGDGSSNDHHMQMRTHGGLKEE
ncbi:hypothetical protein DFH07DRAFT_844861 [Mycena maculata]|uniref:Uncharacterized protein n=1 Tax=Mycena maculata TaxID=230809 RepID=A0AAD7I5C9_9AGAR|nr:hypothetical protein DFH07DRAFT_844861 [Mycena maculata]